MKPLVVVGSINVDMVTTVERLPAPGETVAGGTFEIFHGGKGANQAAAIARLGYPVSLIGRVGDDHFGPELRSSLQQQGVDIGAVRTTPGASGTAIILVTAHGDNSIVVTPGANGFVSIEDIDGHLDVIRGAGMVLSQLEIPIATVEYLASVCRREGVPLVLDPAPARPLSKELLSAVAWFTPNQTEAGFYLPDAIDTLAEGDTSLTGSLIDMGVEGVILKMGERGCRIAARGGLDEIVSAFSVDAVDTTAAGDAFNGAFATALMKGHTPVDSARFASAAAAVSVTRRGAQPSMPTLSEVDELLQTSAGVGRADKGGSR